MDCYKLIAAVKKRPYLWRTPRSERWSKKADILWKQVSKRVGFSVNKVKADWQNLRSRYITHKKQIDKDPDYLCLWKYWLHLKFLDKRNIEAPRKGAKINYHEMISKVKERPHLWKIPGRQRDKITVAKQWKEIAEHVGGDVRRCKRKWNHLRSKYKNHKQREDKLSELLEEWSQTYICKWKYYEDLKFLKDVIDNRSISQSIFKSVNIDTFEFIAQVKERPFLWRNASQKRRKNISEPIWKEIGDYFGVDAKKCIRLWRALRDRYNKMNALSHSPKRDDWEYYESMKFVSRGPNEVKSEKLNLIALIKRRPELWKIEQKPESIKRASILWKEIAEILGTEVNVCKKQWRLLRYEYRRKKRQELTENTPSTWEYFEPLKFLDAMIEAETEKFDRYNLVAKVKDRPELWRVESENNKNRRMISSLWKEVGVLLDTDSDKCKFAWRRMHAIYKKHKENEEKLLESSTKYDCKWEFYEHLKFLDDVNVKVLDRYALIAKVKENPNLWKVNSYQRDASKLTNVWKEIAQDLEVQEQTCRNIWMDLRLLFFKHKEMRDSLLKEDASLMYDCTWEYYDDLKFLDEKAQTTGATPEFFHIEKLKLISKVKEMPYLWTTETKDRDEQIWNNNWTQVKECLGFTEEQCEKQWDKLRSMYVKEKERIELLKHKGSDDEAESEWKYFEYLKFLDSVKKPYIGNQSIKHEEEVEQQLTTDEVNDRLIAEVKKLPYLWKHRFKGARKLISGMWPEVAAICGLDVKTCRSRWHSMKIRYKSKYIAFKENKIDIETLRKFNNYERLKFLNEDFGEELKINNSQNQNVDADTSCQNFDNNSFDDNISSQHSNSTDIDEDLSCVNSQLTQLESVCVKEEPQIQYSSYRSVHLGSIEDVSVKEEPDFKEQDKNVDVVVIKKEDNSEPHAIAGETESHLQYSLPDAAPSRSAKRKFKLNLDPNLFDIFIKDEFEIDLTQANQLENKDKQPVKEEQQSETTDRAVNLNPVKNECIQAESRQANWMENKNDLDIELMEDIGGSENVDTFIRKELDIPSGSELLNENTDPCVVVKNESLDVKPNISNWVENREVSNIEFIRDLTDNQEVTSAVKQELPIGAEPYNSSSDFKEDKAVLSKSRKRSFNMTNESNILPKKKKRTIN